MIALANAVPRSNPGPDGPRSGGLTGVATVAPTVPTALPIARVERGTAASSAPQADDWAGIPLLCRLPEAIEEDAFGDQGAGILVRTVQRVALTDEADALSW